MAVGSAQSGQVALVAGDQHTADDPGEGAIGVPGVEGCSLAGEAGVDELVVPVAAVELGEYERASSAGTDGRGPMASRLS